MGVALSVHTTVVVTSVRKGDSLMTVLIILAAVKTSPGVKGGASSLWLSCYRVVSFATSAYSSELTTVAPADATKTAKSKASGWNIMIMQ